MKSLLSKPFMGSFLAALAAFSAACTYQNLEQGRVDCSAVVLTVNPVSEPATCARADGRVVVRVAGGTPPYLFSLNGNRQPDSVFAGLAAGSYLVEVTDQNGCSAQQEFTIGSVSGLTATASSTQAGCGTANATLSISTAGGTPPYMFTLNNGASGPDSVFTSLPAGTYTVVVSDAEGCEFSFEHQVLSGVSYQQEVRPIILNNCAVSGCHNGTQPPDLRDLTTVQQFKDQIRQRTQSGNMPPDGRTLSQQEIDLIACWIDDGALDN